MKTRCNTVGARLRVVLGPGAAIGPGQAAILEEIKDAGSIAVDGVPDSPLFMTVPTHVAQRNHLAADKRISASLLARGIHIMPLSDEVQT